MIGVLVAMNKEADRILEQLDNVHAHLFAGRAFYEGDCNGESVVLALSGIGKVAAAATTAMLIERYDPDCIINTGIAGGLGKLNVLDVLVADEVWQHDYDLTALGEDLGKFSGAADEELKNALLSVLDNAVVGNVVTGDTFVADRGKSIALAYRYGAKACDMECAAVAQVCTDYGMPFAAIKVISDGADDGAHLTYEELAAKACEINAKAVIALIRGGTLC